MHKPLLIIGIDPGTTTAYAAIDLDGNLLAAKSSKEFDLAAVIKEIISVGFPLIIASDVSPTPHFVEAAATKLGAKLSTPPISPTREEKRELLAAYATNVLDMHQKDALAAAVMALKKHKVTIRKVQSYLKKEHMEHLEPDVQRLVLLNEVHISGALGVLLKPEKEEHQIIRDAIEEQKITKKDFVSLFNRLEETKEQLRREQEENRHKQWQLEQLEGYLKTITRKPMHTKADMQTQKQLEFKEQRIRTLSHEAQGKNALLEKMKKESEEMKLFFLKNRNQNRVILKKLADLSAKELEMKKKKMCLQYNDILLVENPEIHSIHVLEKLKEMQALLICRKEPPQKIKEMLSCISAKELALEEKGDFAAADMQEIEKQIGRKEMLKRVVEEYRKERG